MTAQATRSDGVATSEAARSPGRDDEPMVPPGTGRAVVIGTLIGFIVVFGFSFGASLHFGASAIGAFGVGLFTGFWGGPGFGGMMGFVLHDSHLKQK